MEIDQMFKVTLVNVRKRVAKINQVVKGTLVNVQMGVTTY